MGRAARDQAGAAEPAPRAALRLGQTRGAAGEPDTACLSSGKVRQRDREEGREGRALGDERVSEG